MEVPTSAKPWSLPRAVEASETRVSDVADAGWMPARLKVQKEVRMVFSRKFVFEPRFDSIQTTSRRGWMPPRLKDEKDQNTSIF